MPAGPVLDARDLLEDPQLRARGFYETASCGDGVDRPLIGRPFGWHAETTGVGIRGGGPRFGEAARGRWRMFSRSGRERADALRRDGVVTNAPVERRRSRPRSRSDAAEWVARAG